jgi:hypothetical protein
MDPTEIDVPFRLPVRFIPDLVTGMAMDMTEPEPQTDKDKLDLFQRWVKSRAKQSMLNVRIQRAAALVSVDDSDGLASW